MPQLNTIGNMINNKAFNLALLLTLIGEFLLPWILSWYYDGYNSKTMVMNALGNPQSPVSIAYNIWLIWLGCFLAFTAIVYFLALKTKFPIVTCSFRPIVRYWNDKIRMDTLSYLWQ